MFKKISPSTCLDYVRHSSSSAFEMVNADGGHWIPLKLGPFSVRNSKSYFRRNHVRYIDGGFFKGKISNIFYFSRRRQKHIGSKSADLNDLVFLCASCVRTSTYHIYIVPHLK